MCRNATIRAALLILSSGLAFAQPRPDWRPDWRRIGNSSVDMLLASPATGPVDAVWYARDGSRLYARARSGRVWETSDFENWTASSAVEPAPRTSRLRFRADDPQRVYFFGANVYRSHNGGRAWADLTGFQDRSVIGGPQRDLALSPTDPEQLAVANDFGVWRSTDGGLSWTGLSQLPNLAVRRILATPRRGAGARILLDDVGAVEQQPGGPKEWQVVPDAAAGREAAERAAFSRALGVELTALAGAADFRFAGSRDGRIWTSADGGSAWRLSRPAGGGPVESFYVDARAPQTALAALGGKGAHVLRSINGGLFWDDLTANLPDAAAHAVTADRVGGAIYAATDQGVYLSRASLDAAGPASPWTLVREGSAVDVKLDESANQLYVAVEGFGLYAASAPHRAGTLRLLNAADFSVGAAAPGSLLSVLGGRVSRAQSGGLNFPVLAASEVESQIQVPFEALAGALSLALDAEGRRVNLPLPLEEVAPAVFVDRDGAPLLLDADSGLTLDAGRAAHAGARIQILATGLGRTRPAWPTGLAAPLENPPQVAAGVRVWLDRMPLNVTRATLAPGYIGYYLIEAELPALVNGGPAELYVSADGRESNRVRIYLEP